MVLFLGITLALAGAQAWLSWRILAQDRDLEARRIQERHGQAEDLIGAALLRDISEAEEQLSGLLAAPAGGRVNPPPDDALIAVLRAEEVEAYPRQRLLYYPVLPAPEEPPPSLFASGEERRGQYYEVLERETERLHRLVEGLLDFGRMESGKRQYRFESLDAAELVRSVVAEFQGQVAGRGSKIELSVNGADHAARADREALGRAPWNLLDNAVKYSPECRTVWVEADRAGQRVAIRVRDRGLGIPAAEQKKIFKKFVRGAASEVETVMGTGIGLTMVAHIVRALRGEVRLASEPGQPRYLVSVRGMGYRFDG